MTTSLGQIEQILSRSVCIRLVALRMNLYQKLALSYKKVSDIYSVTLLRHIGTYCACTHACIPVFQGGLLGAFS